jgi:isoaspartyl peptidase/L-asparaginase-like protein (Ntn-hydrolase superfamily)
MVKEALTAPARRIAAAANRSFTLCRYACLMSAARHAEAVRAAIEAMEGTVAVARALVESGRQVELAGLENDATALCAAALALQPQDGRLLRPALEALRDQVDLLAERLPAP